MEHLHAKVYFALFWVPHVPDGIGSSRFDYLSDVRQPFLSFSSPFPFLLICLCFLGPSVSCRAYDGSQGIKGKSSFHERFTEWDLQETYKRVRF